MPLACVLTWVGAGKKITPTTISPYQTTMLRHLGFSVATSRFQCRDTFDSGTSVALGILDVITSLLVPTISPL